MSKRNRPSRFRRNRVRTLASLANKATPAVVGSFARGDRAPAQPRKKPRDRVGGGIRFVKLFARHLYHAWNRIEVGTLSTQFAYSSILSLPSLAILIMSLAATADRTFDIPVATTLQNFINKNAPFEIRSLLQTLVDKAIKNVGEGSLSVSLVASAVLALWSASGGVNTLINASHRAHGLKNTRSFVKRRLVGLMLTASISVFLITAIALAFAGRQIGDKLARHFNLGATFNDLWEQLRIPGVVVGIALSLLLVFQLGMAIRPPLKWTLPGAIFGALGWLGLSAGFQEYLLISNPASPYGGAGNFILLLVFLYLTGFIFIIAAQLNGVIALMRTRRIAWVESRTVDAIEHEGASPQSKNLG
jgi:membrane protein